jgi:hypothetical protein
MTNSPSRKTLAIILWSLGGAGLLAILACGGLLYWGVGTMAELQAASVDAEAFLGLLNAGKVDEAYAATAPAFQARVPLDQFHKFIGQYPAVTKQTRRSARGMRMFYGSTGRRARFEYNVANANNTLTLMLSMVEAGGRWQVESINIP